MHALCCGAAVVQNNVIYDVLIIGAGQAGLATAHCLQCKGLKPLVLESGNRIGNSWRERFESLKLFTPSQYSSLLNWAIPLGADVYPTKDEIANYLESYAQRERIDVRVATTVVRLRREGEIFVSEASTGELRARQVVAATGSLSAPRIPPFAKLLDPLVKQLHSGSYRSPRQIPLGSVLVVGAGNSGSQIVEELSNTRRVTVAFDRMPRCIPQRILGRDIFWWLVKMGVIDRIVPPGSTSREALSR